MGEILDYKNGEQTLEAYVALPAGSERRPCVLICHQWAGTSDFERARAEDLARLGYVGIAIDAYGKGQRGSIATDNSALMNPCMEDRAMLRRRLLAGVEAAKAHPRVDPQRIAAMGYCFGGLCALDIARSGTADVRGVVSFHGLFAAPATGPQAPIKSKVMIHHGWDDPLAPPADVVAVAKEMTEAQADWQFHAYGHAMHAFTSPGANAPDRGLQYNENAARRSWASTLAFFEEVLA